MNVYKVAWGFEDIEATDAEQAARIALELIKEEGSQCLTFAVTSYDDVEIIDLSEK